MQISGIYRCLKHRGGGVTFTSAEPVWKQGLFLISYSSCLGSAAADAALCSAAAPWLWLLLSWLSMRACSFFTSSSSSACTPETRRREGSDTSVDGWQGGPQGWQTETKHKKVCACVRVQRAGRQAPAWRWSGTTRSHRKIRNRLVWHFCNSHVLQLSCSIRCSCTSVCVAVFMISFSVFTQLARKWPWMTTIDFLETPNVIMRFQ